MGYGPLGIWIGMSISNIFTGTASLIWLKYGKWTQPVIRRGKMRIPAHSSKPVMKAKLNKQI